VRQNVKSKKTRRFGTFFCILRHMRRATIVRKHKTVSLFYASAIYDAAFAARVVRALNKSSPSVEAYIRTGQTLSGKVAKCHTGELLVNVQVPMTYPRALVRGWGTLFFDSIQSAATFALFHEVGHAIFGKDQENATDVWAIAIQTDFNLVPPRVRERKPRKPRPRPTRQED